ncbi:MAG: tripartite tricarboxylate transporter TctB family protein [Granulosicoccus sp.]|nr:tripartite tricarboxylate transporter TctB family protein [Granulosicoccus sp.]
MRFNDAVIGCVLVIFALAEIAYTQTFPSLFGQRYGPALFPQIIGAGLIAAGLLLVVRGLIQKRRAGVHGRWLETGPWVNQSRLKINLLLVLLALLAYILLSDWLGFILMSLLTLSVLLYRLGSSIPVSLLIATATTATLYLMFAKLLLVPLPAGLLQELMY